MFAVPQRFVATLPWAIEQCSIVIVGLGSLAASLGGSTLQTRPQWSCLSFTQTLPTATSLTATWLPDLLTTSLTRIRKFFWQPLLLSLPPFHLFLCAIRWPRPV